MKRRRSNTIPDSQDDVSRYGSPDYQDDDTAIALQFEMDMDATIKTEPASQGEPMMTSGPERLPFEPLDDYEPFDGADYPADTDAAVNDTAEPFSFEADDFLERPESAQGLAGTVDEAIPAQPADLDDAANDMEMWDTADGPDDDAASDTSELSAGFFEDVRADLNADLNNLVSEAANVKGQFSREGCRDLRHTLRKWLVQDKSLRPSDHFYHRLESAYTEIRFKARALSKRDRIVVNTFAELAKELPIEIFLVIFEREAVDRAVPLIAKQISDLDAGILVYNVPLDAGSLAFDFQEPLTAAKGKFCEAGLLFVARDSLVDFLMSCSGVPANPSLHPGVRAGTLLSYLKYYIDRCSEPENRPRLLPILKVLCRRAWEADPAQGLGPFADAEVGKLLQLLIEAQDWADTLPELGIPPTTPRYLNIIMAIVEASLLRDVGEQPPVTWGRTKEQVQCGNSNCVLCPQVNEFLGGDAETTSILVPEENNKHTLELVGPTLVAIGCELEPRPPFLVARERFCDRDALEAFYARQEAFKQDLLTDKEWLEPVFQADGTSLDQLIARLSCTDPIVTNAPDRMEEPVQAESAYLPSRPLWQPRRSTRPRQGTLRLPFPRRLQCLHRCDFHRRRRARHPLHSPIMASFRCSLCSTPLSHCPPRTFRIQLRHQHNTHRSTLTAPLNRTPFLRNRIPFLRNETLILCSKTRILRNRTATPRNKIHTRVTLGCTNPTKPLHL